MCFKNYIISSCHLNVLIFSFLVIFFASFGVNSKSQNKVVGDLDIRSFCIILLVVGVLISIYSCMNLCKLKNYELL